MSFKLYDILGLPKGASTDEIKKAYRRKAIVEHPDKGGDPEKFKELTKAYSVLSDENERQKYDQQGDQGYNENGANERGINVNDIFSQFFGGGGGGGAFGIGFPFGNFGHPNGPQQPPPKKPLENYVHVLKISQKDAFFGMTKKIKISIKKTCFSCIDTCTGCRGSGQMNETSQNGMFIQIRTVVCRVCLGEKVMKKFCPDCSNCQGKAFKAEEVLLQAEIPPGVSNEYTITFKGLGEQKRIQDDIEGDFIVVVQVENDPLFLRKGNDLVHKVQIDFIESIIGKKIIVPWYGDVNMEVDISEFVVIKPCPEEYIVTGKGMPKRGSDGFGDLFITFDIKYPKKNELESELKRLKL